MVPNTPVTVNMTKVKQFLDYERLLAFCLIGEELSLFYGKISSQKMDTEENVREVYPNPIANCFRNSTGILEYMKKKLKLSLNMVTAVKIWRSQYDLKAKRQSSEWKSINSLRTKKDWTSKSKMKIMFLAFF